MATYDEWLDACIRLASAKWSDSYKEHERSHDSLASTSYAARHLEYATRLFNSTNELMALLRFDPTRAKRVIAYVEFCCLDPGELERTPPEDIAPFFASIPELFANLFETVTSRSGDPKIMIRDGVSFRVSNFWLLDPMRMLAWQFEDETRVAARNILTRCHRPLCRVAAVTAFGLFITPGQKDGTDHAILNHMLATGQESESVTSAIQEALAGVYSSEY